MGMYTELVIKVSFDVGKLDKTSRKVLDYLFGACEEPSELPDHRFFRCPRWKQIGFGSSFYHPDVVKSYSVQYGSIYLFARTDLKNYDDEIERFIDWVKPIIEQQNGQCIGWSLYEEAATPDLLFANGEA